MRRFAKSSSRTMVVLLCLFAVWSVPAPGATLPAPQVLTLTLEVPSDIDVGETVTLTGQLSLGSIGIQGQVIEIMDGPESRSAVTRSDGRYSVDMTFDNRSYSLYAVAYRGSVVETRSNRSSVSPNEPPDPNFRGTVLLPGQSLYRGEYLAIDGYTLEFQYDYNVVFYGPGHVACWATDTVGSEARELKMQAEDGNLVLYKYNGAALWSSGTAGWSGAHAEMARINNGRAFAVVHSGFTRWRSPIC